MDTAVAAHGANGDRRGKAQRQRRSRVCSALSSHHPPPVFSARQARPPQGQCCCRGACPSQPAGHATVTKRKDPLRTVGQRGKRECVISLSKRNITRDVWVLVTLGSMLAKAQGCTPKTRKSLEECQQAGTRIRTKAGVGCCLQTKLVQPSQLSAKLPEVGRK